MPKNQIDILIYIALGEEFQHIQDSLELELVPDELKKYPVTCYKTTIKSLKTAMHYNVVFAPMGRMGNTQSATYTQALINVYEPKNVVVLGIAGSISGDFSPGDVFVPSNVTEYLANSSGTGIEKIEFKTSGSHFPSNPRLLNRFQNFPIINRNEFAKWKEHSKDAFSEYITSDMQQKLSDLDIKLNIRAELKVADDRNLASGPTVGKGEAFVKFVKEIDRKSCAIEMETAGAYAAVSNLINGPRVISIRGISDLATEKKEKMEEIVGNELRKLCMQNALNLLINAIEQDIFLDEDDISDNEEINREITLASSIKKVFIIGGETGSGGPNDDSAEEMRSICKMVGKELSSANLELVVCSPFSDSADYYAVLGYASGKNNGRIYFHLPNNIEVLERRKKLDEYLERYNSQLPEIINYRYASYYDEYSKDQAWNLCQIQALQDADAVVAIGGREDSSASLLLHLAELWTKPILPFTIIGGAAKTAADRIAWNKLYPNISKKSITGKTSPKNIVNLLHRMSLQNIAKEVEKLGKISNVFISRASGDKHYTENVKNFLQSKNVNVLFGDDAIVSDKEVIPSINEFMAQSQLFIAIWSRNYALSTWCNDELMYAISREKVGLVKIILILIDETPVIPIDARKLIQIKGNGDLSAHEALDDMLKLS